MKQDDVRRLNVAVSDAGEDLYCVTGAVPLFAETAAAFSCDGERPLLLLPGGFVPGGETGGARLAPFAPHLPYGGHAFSFPDHVLAADVRLLGEAPFRAFCRDRGVDRLILPFAELADETEYGGRSAYAWIAEWRAELPYPLRVSALFSSPIEDYGPFLSRFGSPGCTVAVASDRPDFRSYQLKDAAAKYAYTLELAERRAGSRTAVLFTDRREAEEFRRFAGRRGRRTQLFTGGLDDAGQQEALTAFSGGDGLLIATKSVLPSSLFFRADQVVFCGVPYSLSFLARCASFSVNGDLTCCFCPEDIKTDINILRHFAERRPEGERDGYFTEALSRLLQVKIMICDAD